MPRKKTAPKVDEPKGFIVLPEESLTLTLGWNKRQQGWPIGAIRTWETLPSKGQLKIHFGTDHEALIAFEKENDQHFQELLEKFSELKISSIFTVSKKVRVRVYQLVAGEDGGLERKEIN